MRHKLDSDLRFEHCIDKYSVIITIHEHCIDKDDVLMPIQVVSEPLNTVIVVIVIVLLVCLFAISL